MIKKNIPAAFAALSLCAFIKSDTIHQKLDLSITSDSLGACQGISYQNGNIFLYGDRDVGMIRKFKMVNDSLVYQGQEYKLTKKGRM